MLHGHIQSGECHVIFQHWDLPCLLGLGHLKRGSEFYVMGSWMECLWSLITILRYLLYWSLPTDSTDCVHHWLTTVNHISCLWISSRNRLPIPLMVCTSTSAYSLNVFCVNTPLLKSCLFGPCDHPLLACWGILGQFHSTSRTLHQITILLQPFLSQSPHMLLCQGSAVVTCRLLEKKQVKATIEGGSILPSWCK